MRRPLVVIASFVVAAALTARAGGPTAPPSEGAPAQPSNTTFIPAPGSQVPGPVGAPVPAQGAPARDRRGGEPQQGTAVIRGYVVAADTGDPLRRAQVRAFAMGGQGNGMAQTDAQGRFEIAQLPAGRYTVTATRSGYVSLSFGQRAPNQPGTPIEIGEGQVVEKVDFALSRGGAISGPRR